MFRECTNRAELASDAADYFSSDKHRAHGKRIGRNEAKARKLEICNLEENQELQDDILTLYHLSTIAFENSPSPKVVQSSTGNMWIKNLN